MREDEYWVRLEFRLCSEFAGLTDPALNMFWCDGIAPDQYDEHGEHSLVRGTAWVGRDGQQPWQFVLLMGRCPSREDVDWAALLPAADATGWLSVDVARKALKLDPLRPRPDAGPSTPTT